MVFNLEAILFYIILADSITANILVWFGGKKYNKWYNKTFKWWAKRFPATKGWLGWYLLLVLWIGYTLYRMGILPY